MAAEHERDEQAAPERAEAALARWITFIERMLEGMASEAARPAAQWLRERLQAELEVKRRALAALRGSPNPDRRHADRER